MQSFLKKVVYAGLFLVPLVPLLVSSSFFFPFITSKAFAFRIIVEIVFAAWVLLALLDERYRPRKSLILYAVGAFLLVIGVADLLGMNPVKSFWSNFERMEGYITLLHLGAYFLAMSSVFGEVDWKRWWNTSFVVSALMVLYVLMQLAGAITINQGGARVDGTFGNASYLAVYMLFHFFLTLLFFVRNFRRKTLAWVYGLLALSHLFVVYHTATRGAILGVLGGLVVFALLNLRNRENERLKKLSISVLLTMAVVLGGFYIARDTSFIHSSPTLARFTEISTTELQSGGRAFVWPMALKGVAERPILGWGQENFSYVFQKHYVPEMTHLEPWFDRAHNIFLDWAVAGGILGLLAYLFLYIALLYLVWRPAEGDSEEQRVESLSYAEKTALTALASAYFFHNLFVFDHLVSYILFFSLLGYVHSRTSSGLVLRREVRGERVLRVGVPVVAVLLVMAVYTINWKPINANTSIIDALVARQLNNPGQAIDAFEGAYSDSRLGRPEVVEQVAANSIWILESELPMEERNRYFGFTKNAMDEFVEIMKGDARSYIVAGSFLTRTGQFDKSETYLKRAKELIPGKPAVYIETAVLYWSMDDVARARAELQEVLEIAPEYDDAKKLLERI